MSDSLSIVILTYNQKEHTLRLLESLIPYLKARSTTEAVIVDNGSSDHTGAAIERLLSNHPELEGRVRIITLERNLGVAGGRNIGLQSCTSDLLLILDNDTLVNFEALDGLRNHLESDISCGICAPALISPEGELQSSAKPYPGLKLKVAHLLHPGREMAMEKEEMRKKHPWYVIGACQMLRRETFEKVGLLDERIFYGPEDADYCNRVRAAGYTIDYLPQYRIIHDWRRATRRSPFSKLALLHAKGLLYFWCKRLPRIEYR